MFVFAYDCYYEGYIEGVLGFFVFVNICLGFRGVLIKEGKFYGIEFVGVLKKFEYVLYIMAREVRIFCSVIFKDS